MQITEHVFSKKMEFTANTPFGLLKRHAFVFLVKGTEKNCLIDAATKPLLPEVLDFMAETGLRPSDIGEILITPLPLRSHGRIKEPEGAVRLPCGRVKRQCGVDREH